MSVWRWLPKDRLSQRLRDLMEANGWTGERLAELLGIPGSQAQVSRWTTGRVRPQERTLRRIAELAGVPITYFQEEAGENGEAAGGGAEDVDPVQELMDELSDPAAVRAYGPLGLTVDQVMRGAMEHATRNGWGPEQLARLSALRETLNRNATLVQNARHAGTRAEGSRTR